MFNQLFNSELPKFSAMFNLHFILRISVSLLAAHFIVIQGATETVAQLFYESYYYYSIAGSFVIALFLVECIWFVTKRLNSKRKTTAITKQRMIEQFVLGFLSTSLLAFLLAAALYVVNKDDIFNSSYFPKLYAIILLFVFAVNAVYLLYYHQKDIKTRYYNANSGSDSFENIVSHLPAIIFYENRVCFAIDFKGAKTFWASNIEQSRRNLNQHHYFQINRKCIIHRAAIESVSSIRSKHLEIKPRMECPIPLITSRRLNVPFKNWVDNG